MLTDENERRWVSVVLAYIELGFSLLTPIDPRKPKWLFGVLA